MSDARKLHLYEISREPPSLIVAFAKNAFDVGRGQSTYVVACAPR